MDTATLEYTVQCPHCGGEGYLSIAAGSEEPSGDYVHDLIARTVYRCSMCAWRPKFDRVPPDVRRGIRLTTSLAGVTIWKYDFASYYQTTIGTTRLCFINADHLQATIAYIADPLRDLSKLPEQWQRYSRRLPKEIVDGHHRARVLKKLRQLLAEGPP